MIANRVLRIFRRPRSRRTCDETAAGSARRPSAAGAACDGDCRSAPSSSETLRRSAPADFVFAIRPFALATAHSRVAPTAPKAGPWPTSSPTNAGLPSRFGRRRAPPRNGPKVNSLFAGAFQPVGQPDLRESLSLAPWLRPNDAYTPCGSSPGWRLGERRLEVAPPLGRRSFPRAASSLKASLLSKRTFSMITVVYRQRASAASQAPVFRGPGRRPRTSSQASAIIPATMTLARVARSGPTRPRPLRRSVCRHEAWRL